MKNGANPMAGNWTTANKTTYTFKKINKIKKQNKKQKKKLHTLLSFDPAILFLEIYSNTLPTIQKYIGTKLFIEQLFLIVKYWEV